MWDRLFLALAIFLNAVRADNGPYQQSKAYDNGDFGSWPTENYRSTPILGPSVNFIEQSSKCDDGQYILIALRGESVVTPGPTILDQNGHLVWTKHYGQIYNLDVYAYQGEDYLTFWAGDDTLGGHGDGTYYMLDSSYNEAYKIRGPNGLPADLHEFHITRNGTAVFTVYDIISADLRPVGGPKRGWIWDGTFVEVDIETGELLFEWHASEHFDLTEFTQTRDSVGDSYDHPWDFFHINSVDKDAEGNFLISALYTDHLTYIDGHTGDIIWRLGGSHSNFKDLSDGAASNFTWQHHARFQDNDAAITVFDNVARDKHPIKHSSRGLYLDIDQTKMTVKIRHEYWNSHHAVTPQTQGSLQLLDSGHVFVGYGLNAAWTEFTIDGKELCHVHFGPQSSFGTGSLASYRIAKRSWTGYPRTTPDFEIHGYEAAVSWNGATEVTTWVLEGANAAVPTKNNEPSDHFEFLTALPKTGFETIISIPPHTTQAFLRVKAVNAAGFILGTTATLPWDPTSSELVTSNLTHIAAPGKFYTDHEENHKDMNGGRHIALRSTLFFIFGFISAFIFAGSIRTFRRCRAQRAARRRGGGGGGWKAIDGPEEDEERGHADDTESDSDSDGSDIEFSLLGNPRLSPRPGSVDPGYASASASANGSPQLGDGTVKKED
ncbi:hypothetical protein AOCH_005521 [Aspergillus ochraceoroseus]|uniref:ASST-domain-containing protein n=1 Tax=Aspergillus ochraceoroseus TaxID=138278 RepID=A0A0F8WA44_9EURO|nr:hypothetical protein AOCH_005521 [Aspergillus ochraceoroseus]